MEEKRYAISDTSAVHFDQGLPSSAQQGTMRSRVIKLRKLLVRYYAELGNHWFQSTSLIRPHQIRILDNLLFTEKEMHENYSSEGMSAKGTRCQPYVRCVFHSMLPAKRFIVRLKQRIFFQKWIPSWSPHLWNAHLFVCIRQCFPCICRYLTTLITQEMLSFFITKNDVTIQIQIN